MIKLMHDLPANVLGYAIIGELEGHDYEILRPALNEYARGTAGGVNILVDVTEASGLSTRALWEEAKLEWDKAGVVQRVALIGAPLWTRPFIKLADMLRLGTEVHTFEAERKREAVAWLAGVVAYQ